MSEVPEDGPAAAAGIRPGDIITHVDDEEIASMEALIAVLLGREPGDEVQVRFVREGNRHSVTVVLGSFPG